MAASNKTKIDPRFTAYALLAKRSRIAGCGVFAEESIPAKERVIEYSGEKIRYAEATGRFFRDMGEGGSKRSYLFRLNRGWVVDGAVGGSGAELINHSCDPNLEARGENGHILLYSIKKIHKGDELTIDYYFEADAYHSPCRCGSPKCRGRMNRQE
jgi:SET domain-containing protein